jgi:hypothetical protein
LACLAHLQTLTVFEISNNDKVSPNGLRSLIQSSTNLHILYIENCARVEPQAFMMCKLSALKNLTLRRCASIEDTVKLISEAQGARQFLDKVDLTGSIHLRDIALHSLASKCINISSLTLKGCAQVSDASMERVMQLRHLKTLVLQDCCLLTDRIFVGDHVSKLTSLDLGGCMEITDVGMHRLSTMCPHLRTLNLSFCHRITDLGMRHLLYGCRSLQILNLRGCAGITAVSLDYLTACACLSSLNLFGIPNLTLDAVKNLVTRATTLDSLVLMSRASLPDTTPEVLLKVKPELNCHFAQDPPATDMEPVRLSQAVDYSSQPTSRRSSAALSRGSSAIHLLSSGRRFTRPSSQFLNVPAASAGALHELDEF